MRPAREDAGGWRERRVSQQLAAGLGRRAVERGAFGVVDEPGLVDAGFRRRDVGLVSGEGGTGRSARRRVSRSALHGCRRDQLLGERALAGRERLRPAGRFRRRTAPTRPTRELRHVFLILRPYRVVIPRSDATPNARARNQSTAPRTLTQQARSSRSAAAVFVVSANELTVVASSVSVTSASAATSP